MMDVQMDSEIARRVARPQRVAGNDRLVRDHAGLVRRLAWQTHSRMSGAIEVEDLVQTGMVALVEAARNFVDRGEAAFATYATVRVRGAMLDSLRRQAPLNRGALRRRRELMAARAPYENGVTPDNAEVAARLGITPRELAQTEVATMMPRIESLDAAYSDHDRAFAAPDPDALERLAHGRRRDDLARAIATLPSRQAQVLQLYFVEELNLEDIGEVLDVGAARVCQIKRSALERLRSTLAAWA